MQQHADFTARETARTIDKHLPPLDIPLNPAWRTMLLGELAGEDEVTKPKTAPGGAAARGQQPAPSVPPDTGLPATPYFDEQVWVHLLRTSGTLLRPDELI
jgi:hypothetical protein